MAATTKNKAKIIGPAQKKQIWASTKKLELAIQKHKKMLEHLHISGGGNG